MRCFLFALTCWSFACVTSPQPAPPQQQQAQAGNPYPPSVLLGEAHLTCDIDASANGVQKLELTGGGGLEFDAVVSPIVDGSVDQNGPEKGGAYRFASHLAKPAKGKLSGVGEVELEELETKVSVEVDRYNQPGGPGKEFHFSHEDLAKKGTYVEFMGIARSKKGERYTFRVNMGAPKGGSGKVRPKDANYRTEPMAKSVMVYAPMTTVVDISTSIRKLP
jgi:hypothetical protein